MTLFEPKECFAGEVTAMVGLIHKNPHLHLGFLWICRAVEL